MAVPFIDLKRWEPGFQDAWQKRVRELSESAQFIGGPEVAGLEADLVRETGAKHCIGCANGTDALQLALRAAGVGRGDTVLLPDATFWATFEAVVNVGADPVTVDIDMTDLQMDYDLFVQAVRTHKPKAAMLVHLYGWGSRRLEDYRQFCRENHVILIEDGAQAYGATYKGNSLYKDALLSTVSFYPAKVLGGAGDAGAVFTSSDEYAERLRSLGNHGRATHYSYGAVGWNSRISAFQAAYIRLSIPHVKARIESRRAAVKQYRTHLGELPSVRPPEGFEENGYLYCILYNPSERSSVEARLKEKGIGFANTYPGSMSSQAGAKGYIKAAVGGDNARKLAESILNPPLFPYMTDAEVSEVVQSLRPKAAPFVG
ncbi:MAG TPA: DegT/DnrJ/EryC1/StrS family aminotransferase [Leptospiraceae bacterium]|nr:DegT/DnrJ/EryC1/StrS family aminotransferase [Leptospiraceae bacterium]